MKRQIIFRLAVALLLSLIFTLPTVAPTLAAPPDNDNFDYATAITSLPFSNGVDNAEATLQLGEPTPTCAWNFGGRTVWYAYTPATSGSFYAYVDSDFDRVFAVYTGTSFDSLTELGCRFNSERLAFSAQVGTTYYFQVGSFYDSGGQMSFHLDVAPPPWAEFSFNPSDPSSLDTLSFNDNSYDPYGGAIQSQSWNLGDGVMASGCCPTHRYAADGDYTVALSVTTYDGRTGSVTKNVAVRTHDVAITKFTVPNAASAGQTRNIGVGINSRRYDETVAVQLFKDNPSAISQEKLGFSVDQNSCRDGMKNRVSGLFLH